MPRNTTRVDKIERTVKPRRRIVHVKPGQTKAAALRAYERAHGKIPANARVLVIHHTFTSRV